MMSFNHVKFTAALLMLAASLPALVFARPAEAAFPGENGRISFYTRGDVWTMDPNGAGPTRLTTDYNAEGNPAYSPDGTQIVFTSDRSGNMEIYRMKTRPEGSKNRPVNLSRNPSYDSSPAWSPDGKKIAFSSDRPAPDGTRDYEIWRMRATDGANPINLTNDPGADFYPAWQPLP